jgi:hypothetical protein
MLFLLAMLALVLWRMRRPIPVLLTKNPRDSPSSMTPMLELETPSIPGTPGGAVSSGSDFSVQANKLRKHHSHRNPFRHISPESE